MESSRMRRWSYDYLVGIDKCKQEGESIDYLDGVVRYTQYSKKILAA